MEQELNIRPTTYRKACDFIRKIHRHHGIPQGHKFSISCVVTYKASDVKSKREIRIYDVIGVAVVGRPTGRYTDKGEKVTIGGVMLQNVFIAEVTRLCVDDSHPMSPNACSKLYAACQRIVKNMGYDWVITYILDTEGGYSLKAAGWHKDKGRFGGKSWSVPSRPRTNKSPEQLKFRYYAELS